MESKMLAEIRFRWLRFESPPRLIKMHDQPPLYIYIQISVLFIIAFGQTFANAEPATTGSSDNTGQQCHGEEKIRTIASFDIMNFELSELYPHFYSFSF